MAIKLTKDVTGFELTFQSCIMKNSNKFSLLFMSPECTSGWV